jgi:hypothetical protein
LALVLAVEELAVVAVVAVELIFVSGRWTST